MSRTPSRALAASTTCCVVKVRADQADIDNQHLTKARPVDLANVLLTTAPDARREGRILRRTRASFGLVSLAIGAAQASQARIVSLWLVFGPGVLVACTRIFKVSE